MLTKTTIPSRVRSENEKLGTFCKPECVYVNTRTHKNRQGIVERKNDKTVWVIATDDRLPAKFFCRRASVVFLLEDDANDALFPLNVVQTKVKMQKKITDCCTQGEKSAWSKPTVNGTVELTKSGIAYGRVPKTSDTTSISDDVHRMDEMIRQAQYYLELACKYGDRHRNKTND
jgi:hypothetical protein